MPTVPTSRLQPASGPKPSETDLLMALSTMQDLGRLNPNVPSRYKELLDLGVNTAEDELIANRGPFSYSQEEIQKRRKEKADRENNMLQERKKLDRDI